jgi:Amt family ammonium transporter
MKKLLVSLALGLSVLAAGTTGFAQTPAAPAEAPAASAPAATAPAAAPAAAAPAAAAAAPAAAEAAPAAAPAPSFNKGDTSWMMLSTLLVIMMTIPGLALFYGGLVRSKNMLSVLMQVMVTFSLIVVLWLIYGYSIAFTEGNAFFGGFDRLFMKGIFDPATGVFAPGATFSKGVYIPELLFAAFQATFAGITCCLIVGAFAERAKFSAVLLFMVIWFTFSYAPLAHMVWFWMGPDAYTAANVVDANNAKAGLIWQWGALDFAGGTVVHINAAVAGLVGAFVIGKRVGYGKEAFTPHSLTLTMVGASLLWVGWFGFNAGSALEAGTSAVLAFMNTFSATAAAVLAWCIGEALMRGKASMLGAASGAVAGLVAITPAAGNVGLMGALGDRLHRRLRLPLGRQRPEKAARRRRLAGRVRRARCRRYRRRAAHRRVQHPGPGRPRPRGRLGHGQRHLERHRCPSLDPAEGRAADHRLVGRGGVHRLQDRRPHHRPACVGRRRARRPRHLLARRNRLQPLTGHCGAPRGFAAG